MYLGKIDNSRGSYWKYIIIFAVISLILVGGVSYAVFSKAEIKLIPQREQIEVDFGVTVSEGADLASGDGVSGRIVSEELEATKLIADVPTKGVEQQAKGKVIIHNNRDEGQPLLPKTQLATKDGIIFRTDSRADVPAKGKAEVGVTADQPGKMGNIEPQRLEIVKIWDQWKDLIYAENKEPMSGGYREAKIVDAAELERGKNLLTADLKGEGIDKLKAKLKSGEAIFEDGVQVEVLKYEPKIQENAEASQYQADIKIKISAVILAEDILREVATLKLKERVAEGMEFGGIDEATFSYQLKSINEAEKSARVKVYLTGWMIPMIPDEAHDKKSLTGRNKEEVADFYERIPEIDSVEVTFSPFYVTSVPGNDEQVEIILEK